MSEIVSDGNGATVPARREDEGYAGLISERLSVLRQRVDATTALDWLTRNSHNRRLNDSWVAHLAEEMSGGRWKFNGETIIFDDAGELMDGQHRLQAVFEADAAIEFLVVRGVKRESFHTIDTGRVRSAGDVLGIEGHAYAHTLASAAGWLFRMQRGDHENKRRIPHSVLLGYLREHPEVISSMHYVRGVGIPPRLIPAGIAIALHSMLSAVDQDEADRFVASLLLGSNLSEDSPILKLRERFMAASSVTGAKSQRLAGHERLALAIKVWNATRTGKNIQVLVYRHRGKASESFPTPV